MSRRNVRLLSHHNAFLDLEELTEAELEEFRVHYLALPRHARIRAEMGLEDTDSPDISGIFKVTEENRNLK